MKVEFTSNGVKDETGYTVSPLMAYRMSQGAETFMADRINGTQMSDARRAFVEEHAQEYELIEVIGRSSKGNIPAVMLRARMSPTKAVEHHMLFPEEIISGPSN